MDMFACTKVPEMVTLALNSEVSGNAEELPGFVADAVSRTELKGMLAFTCQLPLGSGAALEPAVEMKRAGEILSGSFGIASM